MDETITHRKALEKNLIECKENDIVIPYRKVAQAFPGDDHECTFDIQRIDSETLQPWAKELGWSAKPAPEITPPSKKNMPLIRFTRIL